MMIKTRTTYVWAILSAITILSWWLPTEGTGRSHRSVAITCAVFAMGLVKLRLVLREFMEVRTAPVWLRRSTDLWLVALWGSLLVIYLV